MKYLMMACFLLVLLAASGCDAWTVQPLPYATASPFSSSTPIILSSTPIVLPFPVTATGDVTPTSATNPAPTATNTYSPAGTDTATTTLILPASMTLTSTITATPFSSVQTKILGCSNGLDITHGMGEVTNAYVTIQNIGNQDFTNVCATLNALQEGRLHPDKTKCTPSLPAGFQVSEKLTVDSTFGVDSPVQVDVLSGATLLQRVTQNSCVDSSLLVPKLNNLGTVTPIPTP